MKKIVAALLLVSLLAACARGREFVKPENDAIVLGSTTYDQVVESHGRPRSSGTITRNGVSLRTLTYSRSVAVPYTTRLSVKVLTFVFQGDTLVSYDYVSSFAEEKDDVNLDEEKVKQIATGDKKSKVLEILGKPTGEAIYPTAAKGGSLFRYTYLRTYRIPFVARAKVARKVVTISFDANEVVTEITSTETNPN